MKLFLDDIRFPPDDTWTLVRTYDDCICMLQENYVSELSLDNDLSFDEPEGKTVITWLISRFTNHSVPPPGTIIAHTANPIAADEMEHLCLDLSGLLYEKNWSWHPVRFLRVGITTYSKEA